MDVDDEAVEAFFEEAEIEFGVKVLVGGVEVVEEL